MEKEEKEEEKKEKRRRNDRRKRGRKRKGRRRVSRQARKYMLSSPIISHTNCAGVYGEASVMNRYIWGLVRDLP